MNKPDDMLAFMQRVSQDMAKDMAWQSDKLHMSPEVQAAYIRASSDMLVAMLMKDAANDIRDQLSRIATAIAHGRA